MVSGGEHGWGESACWGTPFYCPEWSPGQFLLLREVLGPLLLGCDIRSGGELQERLSPVRGNQFAKASLDLAWWDLHARMLGKPLWDVLGGVGDTVEVGEDFGAMGSIEALLEAVGSAVAAGFRRMKLKYRPGWELEMVAAVREAFPDTVLHVDCNSAYTLADLPMLRELDQFELAMIEQPLAHDDLIDHARLQKQITTPICLDESIISVEKARKAVEIGACQWVNIKPGRVGGLTNAVGIHDCCRKANVPCWVGGMAESAVGGAHCIALATLPNIRYPSDIFPSERFLKEDVSVPETVLSGPSKVTAQPGPGIGVEPDPERLQRRTAEHAILGG
jgi:O-succinylbenzoate synthase